MITSTENYSRKTNKQTKTDRQNPRTDVKSKAIKTNSQKEAYTYTLTKREKGKIYIYIYIFFKKEESNQISKQIYQ